LATGLAEAELTVSEVGTSRAVAAATATPSGEVPEGIADPTLAPVVAVVPQVWDLVVAAEDSVVVVVVAGGGDKRRELCVQEQTMKSSSVHRELYKLAWLLGLVVCGPCSSVMSAAQQTVTKEVSSAGTSVSDVRTFDTPQQAATLLITAAEDFNVPP
jgi:hypothetical protein